MTPTDDERAAILFVDDEPFFAARYVEALEQHYRVHFLNRAIEVVPFLDENPTVSAVVLDVMMPTPAGVDEAETQRGLDTGLWLLDKMQYLGTWPLPVLILTNRRPAAIAEELTTRKINRELISIRQKCDTRATLLPELVGEILARGR